MTAGTEAFPLQWPTGWQRTRLARPAPFATSFASARDALITS